MLLQIYKQCRHCHIVIIIDLSIFAFMKRFLTAALLTVTCAAGGWMSAVCQTVHNPVNGISFGADTGGYDCRIAFSWQNAKLPEKLCGSETGFVSSLMDRIIADAVNARFDRMVISAESPLTSAVLTISVQEDGSENVVLESFAWRGSTVEALRSLSLEMERIRRFGITEREMEDALERYRSKADVSPETEAALDRLTREILSDAAAGIFPEEGMLLTYCGPLLNDDASATEEHLFALTDAVAEMEVEDTYAAYGTSDDSNGLPGNDRLTRKEQRRMKRMMRRAGRR